MKVTRCYVSILCFLRPMHHDSWVSQQFTLTWSWCHSRQTTQVSAPANAGLKPAGPAPGRMSYDELHTL